MYVTLNELKSYLTITESNDDDLLMGALLEAGAEVDRYFPARFELGDMESRIYDKCALYKGRLQLDKPLFQELSGLYRRYPLNLEYSWELAPFDPDMGFLWDPDDTLTISGFWCYTEIAPPDVKNAVKRLASYKYRQKDSQTFETTAVPELGIMTIPSGTPSDVKQIIARLQANYNLA